MKYRIANVYPIARVIAIPIAVVLTYYIFNLIDVMVRVFK